MKEKNRKTLTFGVILLAISVTFKEFLSEISSRIASGILCVLLGLLLAYFLNMSVLPLERLISSRCKGKSKSRAFALVLGGLIGVGAVFIFFYLTLPPLVSDVEKFVGNLPVYREKTAEFFAGIFGSDNVQKVSDFINSYFEKGIANLSSQVAEIFKNGAKSLSFLFTTVFVSVTALVVKNSLKRSVFRFLTTRYSAVTFLKIRAFGLGVDAIMRGYFNARITVGGIMGTLFFVIYALLGVPHALFFSVLMAILYFIPYLGAYFAFLPALLTAVITAPQNAVILAVSGLVLLNVEGIVTPKFLTAKLNVGVFSVLVSIVIGANLCGVVGALVAPPICAVCALFVRLKTMGRSAKSSKKETSIFQNGK